MVARSKARRFSELVFPQSSQKIICHADVEYCVALIGDDVNGEFVGRHSNKQMISGILRAFKEASTVFPMNSENEPSKKRGHSERSVVEGFVGRPMRSEESRGMTEWLSSMTARASGTHEILRLRVTPAFAHSDTPLRMTGDLRG